LIRIEPACFINLALMILLLPVDWLQAAILAALVHEVCHVAVLFLFHGRISRIVLGVNGCVIQTDTLGDLPQFLSILAGPVGSILLVLLRQILSKVAICGLLHGIYNLLPILPLDGGRLLRILLNNTVPDIAEKILTGVMYGVYILFLLLGIYGSACYALGAAPLTAALMMILLGGREKFLANCHKSGYNNRSNF